MPREIYNEGRVVGLSAYEIYVKQHLNEDPDNPPATEKEWLAASLASGASMLLKLKGATSHSSSSDYCISDIILPYSTSLAAANTIVASPFLGEATFDSNSAMSNFEWADSVSSCGPLFDKHYMYENTEELGIGELVGHYVDFLTLQNGISETNRKRLKNYSKILDGIVLQPGTYYKNEPKLDPEFYGDYVCPLIRLWLADGDIQQGEEPLILLTGFTSKSALIGETKLEGSDKPEDGDFLGPGLFPWVNKIVFTVTTPYMKYLINTLYDRTIYETEISGELYTVSKATVSDSPVIDMRSNAASMPTSGNAGKAPVLENYYDNSTNWDNIFWEGSDSASRLESKRLARTPIDVDDISSSGDASSILTVYQRNFGFPPALFGTFADSNGRHYLHPIDVVSPGSVKVFNENATVVQLKLYESIFPGTVAMKKDANGKLYTVDSNGALVPVADSTSISQSKGISRKIGTDSVTTISSTLEDPSLYVQGYSQELAVHWGYDLSALPTLSYSETTYNRVRSFEQSNGTNQEHVVVNLKYIISEDNISVQRYIPDSGTTEIIDVPSSIKIQFTTEVLPTETSGSWGTNGENVLELGIVGNFGDTITHDSSSSLNGTFTFCHSSGPTNANKQYANSRLFGLNFSGPLEYLQYQGTSTKWLYGFSSSINQSGISHGIWNITGVDGLRYDYNYAVWDDKVTGAMDDNSRLVICAMNCGDGYNTRIENDPTITSQLSNMYCTYMNFSAELTLYVKDEFKQ